MKTNPILARLLAGSCMFALISCTKNQNTPAIENPGTVNNTSGNLNLLSTLWDGDAALGASNVWKTVNYEGSGTITVETDPAYGAVWKFYKPAGSHRTEGHGAENYQALDGDDIYIGWRSKLVMPMDLRTNALFQWKAYGSGQPMTQNYPIVLKTTETGILELWHFAPGKIGTALWSAPLTVNIWNSMVMRIKVSRDGAVGFIEFWYNGIKQTLVNGTQRYPARTLDADYCDPKFGAYGGDAGTVTNYVHALKIGSAYADVAPVEALKAQLFKNCSYGGWAASFEIGDYTAVDIAAKGGINNDASSIKIPAGLKVTLYDGDNFTGSSLVLTGSVNVSCLSSNSFNDKTSSLKVSAN
ncbi:hypothetical protein GFS24_03040 [Chitinophaga sp. SYP-B3965]|uniref:heparin lyase I family protein n=1 Tax=Chitinophaga sp. SYP-B3965 TaxID=2663120 RepID=UPI001299CED9|nr:heparin lyase I family protein [Chitinophaga sp. SYP-B3965]MRG44069.1 hypothetical protein [Chitinophaga sp. SYP-B3965]